ncbi:putative crinkler family protein [Gigaspora margarita]|uniref:Putative crinkler family protein n=1 Tax=Gigaspora margarita TaxID=4874 RepID=A0A8H3WUA1_GIGMA|nr:putative crinkler family protein [Gigaspora margarita]
MKPEPLLCTSGANWEYQPHSSLKHILQRELKKHYKNFLLGRFDKMTLPLYLFLSGAGSGKSRNANEFHQTAISCLSTQEDKELLTRIKEAWVFFVSYENGTSLRNNEYQPYLAIGTRMLLQLLRERMNLDKIIEIYDPPSPLEVVLLLMENKDDGLNSNSQFYRTLSSIGDLLFSRIFIIPVFTSTITGPIESTLKYSHRKRVYLPVASLQPPNYRKGDSLIPVFKNDEITNTLVEDCGRHGRALEALNDCLAGRNIEECNIDTLMNDLRNNLTDMYRDAIFGSVRDARPIARVILTRRLLDLYKPVPKTDKTPDQFAGSGLIRFEQINKDSPKGYLTAPYIWLWIFVEISHEQGDPILRDWEFADYGEQRALLNPVSSLQVKSWQSFEKFVASFRCIKSAVIEEDELTTISEVHAGARLNGDIKFKNHNLQLEVARHQTDTKSKNHNGSVWDVDCYNSTIDVRRFKHCIVNAPNSPYGDAFLSLDQLENCNIKLPKRSGIVDGKAFKDYFGPFAGRAYKSALVKSKLPICNQVKNIHTTSFGQLYRVNQIRKGLFLKRPCKKIKNFHFRSSLIISQNVPTPRGDHAAVLLPTGIIIYIGGYIVVSSIDSAISMNEIQLFDTNSLSLTTRVFQNENIILYGGSAGSNLGSRVLPDLAVLDTNIWDLSIPSISQSNAPPPLTFHSAVLSHSGRITTATNLTLNGNIYIFDTANYVWVTRLNSIIPSTTSTVTTATSVISTTTS